MATALNQLEVKIETLTNQIESLTAEIKTIEGKKIKLADLQERVKDLALAQEAISESKNLFSEILGELATKAANEEGATIADIKTAFETAEIEMPDIVSNE